LIIDYPQKAECYADQVPSLRHGAPFCRLEYCERKEWKYLAL